MKGVGGRGVKIIVLFGTAIARGTLAQLNVMIGVTRGRVEIWGNKGDIAVPSSQDERLIQAHYVYWYTAARSRNRCCRRKN